MTSEKDMADFHGSGRRRFLARVAGGFGAMMLAGCDDRLSANPDVTRILDGAEAVSRFVQKALTGRKALAREYSEADISTQFRANGTTEPSDPDYQRLAENGFADWRLVVGGLVTKPGSFSLAELKQMPSRTQITRHDCVEGWSCIGKWKGVPLAGLLDLVGPRPEARYVMFLCADAMDLSGNKYYESIDLDDACHPQTILAYEMNDQALPVAHGAPLRLRDERQLGYKMAKYIMSIELVEDFSKIGDGKGGYWEDQGYEWWAGI
jgi:DMSO/TMAO reductase YedYZ molybdopterin-dependent catalytic subunit